MAEALSTDLHTVSARQDVHETKLDALQSSVVGLVRSVDGLRDIVANHRDPIPFKEILTTMALTLGMVATLATFANYWHAQANAVNVYRLEQLERRLPAPVFSHSMAMPTTTQTQ